MLVLPRSGGTGKTNSFLVLQAALYTFFTIIKGVEMEKYSRMVPPAEELMHITDTLSSLALIHLR